MGPFAVLFVLWILVFFIFNLYDLRKINPNPRNIGQLVLAMSVNIIVGGFLFYLFPFFGISPKINLLLVGIISFVLLVIWHRLFYLIFNSVIARKIAIVGTSDAVEQFIHKIKEYPELGKVVAQYDSVSAMQKAMESDLPAIDLLIAQTHTPKELLSVMQKLQCQVVSLLEAYEELLAKIPVTLVTEEYAMHILAKQEGFGYTLVRRVVEDVLAVVLLIITAPFSAITIGAIYFEDHGPIFIRQKRVGKNGRLFSLYKFRSMIAAGKDGLAETNGAVWSEGAHDPRITKVGQVIRKLHIDEIPQMWNVIKGDLALVGPRPERPEFTEKLEAEIPYYYVRHTIQPGFTGWAQIKFRYARTILDSQEKLEYDLYYLANRNLLLDLGIILKTVQIIFTH